MLSQGANNALGNFVGHVLNLGRLLTRFVQQTERSAQSGIQLVFRHSVGVVLLEQVLQLLNRLRAEINANGELRRKKT